MRVIFFRGVARERMEENESVLRGTSARAYGMSVGDNGKIKK